MTLPTSQATPSAPTGNKAPVGNRAGTAPQIDLEQLTQKVYDLMLEDLRLELARREGRVR